MKLGELQAMLAREIEFPGSVDPELLRRSIAERAPLDAVARADIYAEMYRFRLADALRADYPKVARLLGDEGFFKLSEAYAQEHPSASSDIGQFGQALADFLAEHPGPRGDEADLACLEWARAQAFTARDTEPLLQRDLGQLGEKAVDARLGFVPALTSLLLAHDVLPLWESLEETDGEPPEVPEVNNGPVHVAVWRQGFQVLHRAMPQEEADALERARTGATLAEVCEAFSALPDAQAQAFRTLGAWFSGGWVARVETA
jgi:hypothetical protein